MARWWWRATCFSIHLEVDAVKLHWAIYKLFFARLISNNFRYTYLVSVQRLIWPTLKVSRVPITYNLRLVFWTSEFCWRFKRIDSNYTSSFNQRRLRYEQFIVLLWGMKSHLLWWFILKSLVGVKASQKLDFVDLSFSIPVGVV